MILKIKQVLGLQTELDGKSDTSHTHNYVSNDATGETDATGVVKAVYLTQTEYDALTPTTGVLYVITGA